MVWCVKLYSDSSRYMFLYTWNSCRLLSSGKCKATPVEVISLRYFLTVHVA
jgi:hypothetical protein